MEREGRERIEREREREMNSKYKIVQRMTERTKRGQRGGGEIKRRKKREEEKEEARQKARKKPDEAVTDRNSLGQLAGLASLEVSSIPGTTEEKN